MARRRSQVREFSRRQALRVCLAPVGVVAARWLSACAEPREGAADRHGDSDDDSSEAPSRSDASEASGRTSDARVSGSDARDASAASSRDARAAEPEVDAGASTRSPSGGGEDGGRAQDAAGATRGDDAGAMSGSDASANGGAWASGGTKSMQGGYPDPFASGAAGAACALYPAQTLGPCYSSPVAAREDISDGITGLPLRLSFLVVRSDGCTPVADAEVDIWHTGYHGVYSAFASGICNPDRMDVASQRFCRGKQSTNAQGRVDFSTVFPGWYSGRTIHIHFTVRVGNQAFITSQLYFEDALCDEIMQEADYKARGRRDTTNRNDSILRSANPAPLLFSTAKRGDGAMHAWKVLSIRS